METQPLTVPVLVLDHQGTQRTLTKHPAYVRAFKDGKMTLAQLLARPWNLRLEAGGNVEKFKLSPVDKDALRRAKDILNGQREDPDDFAEWQKQRRARRGLTLGELNIEWKELGYPDHNGRPRDDDAVINIEAFLTSALAWWSNTPVAVADTRFADFIAWRRTHSKRGTGERAADLELNALSCLCRWAVFAQRIEENPFRGPNQGGKRPTYRDKEEVSHCFEAMPASDEELHLGLAWFFANPADTRRVVAGAWLAWCSLTGLRPGEPAFLKRHKAMDLPPVAPKQLAPGTVFPTRDGKLKMKVQRLKRGQNPYILLHPAAVEFLADYQAWQNAHLPDALYLFPDPDNLEQPLRDTGDKVLNGYLERACEETKITPCKPHGFGRGYYVRVRRSQGIEDPTIAGELGQTSNGAVIRESYGDPDDMVGGALLDWLPQDDKQQPAAPAWKSLNAPLPANVIPYQAEA